MYSSVYVFSALPSHPSIRQGFGTIVFHFFRKDFGFVFSFVFHTHCPHL